MRSRHFYYAFLILDKLHRVCYYNVEDLMYYINVNDLYIIEENEDLENNVITIDCEEA